MKTLGGSLPTNIAKKYTDPVYLVEIKFAAWMYLSSREAVTVTTDSGSHNFLPNRIMDVKVSGNKASVALENGDRSISAAALTGQIKGNSCIIYISYGADVVKQFAGEIVALEMSDDNRGSRVDFSLESVAVLQSRWPLVRIGKGLGFNWLPQAGLSFTYGTTRYTLEASK